VAPADLPLFLFLLQSTGVAARPGRAAPRWNGTAGGPLAGCSRTTLIESLQRSPRGAKSLAHKRQSPAGPLAPLPHIARGPRPYWSQSVLPCNAPTLPKLGMAKTRPTQAPATPEYICCGSKRCTFRSVSHGHEYLWCRYLTLPDASWLSYASQLRGWATVSSWNPGEVGELGCAG